MKHIEKTYVSIENQNNSPSLKNICLTVLSVNSVYEFSEMYLSNRYLSNRFIYLNKFLLQINSSYFSKMALVGFQYEPVRLDINEVYFEEEQDIPNTREKSRSNAHKFEYLSCSQLKFSDTFNYR